jgi:phosphoribosylglycinamide formyltransferase-1
MVRIALFASGNGSNVENLYRVFDQHPRIQFPVLICNRENAPVVKLAQGFKKNIQIISKRTLEQPTVQSFIAFLKQERIDWIILSGFLLHVPAALIQAFPQRIINLHPSLLPKYGGKGMYGIHVHKAVLQQHEQYSGATVHYVNDLYDTGEIILQRVCAVDANDTPERLALKVRAIEFEILPEVIKTLILPGTKAV